MRNGETDHYLKRKYGLVQPFHPWNRITLLDTKLKKALWSYLTSEYSATATSDDAKVPRTLPIFHVWQIEQWTVRVKIEGMNAH